MIPLRQPHVVDLYRPTVSKTQENASVLTYPGSPTRRIYGFLQQRGGEVTSTEDGQVYAYDSVFYTREADVLVDDILMSTVVGLSGKFRVLGVEAKHDIRGVFNHLQVALVKEIRR